MYASLRLLILTISVVILIAITNLLPLGYAQSNSVPKPFCPTGSLPVGLSCQSKPFGDLPPTTGSVNWSIHVNGINGILNMSCISCELLGSRGQVESGKVEGTMWNSSNVLSKPYLCTVSHPCKIDGFLNGETGMISFKAIPTIETLNHSFQNYTGYVNIYTDLQTSTYTLAGTGRSFAPDPGPEFGWYATKSYFHP